MELSKNTQKAIECACIRAHIAYDDFIIKGEIRYNRGNFITSYYVGDLLVMTEFGGKYLDGGNIEIDVTNPYVLLSNVIHWLNGWEQIKDTIIPLRLKEHFTE